VPKVARRRIVHRAFQHIIVSVTFPLRRSCGAKQWHPVLRACRWRLGTNSYRWTCRDSFRGVFFEHFSRTHTSMSQRLFDRELNWAPNGIQSTEIGRPLVGCSVEAAASWMPSPMDLQQFQLHTVVERRWVRGFHTQYRSACGSLGLARLLVLETAQPPKALLRQRLHRVSRAMYPLSRSAHRPKHVGTFVSILRQDQTRAQAA